MTSNDSDLIIRSLDDDLSPEERARLDDLLDASPDARQALAEHRAVRRLVAEHGRAAFGSGFADDVMNALRDAEAPADAPRRDRPAAAPPSQSGARAVSMTWRRAGAALAVVVLLVGVALGWWLWPRAVHVAPGQTQVVALADGSTVELSAGSTLEYRPFWGRDIRHVQLDGEAFFTVAEAARPFVVETFNARITVTGTRFNVRGWTDDPAQETAVTLASGRVDVAPRLDAADPVTLAPGETAVTRADTARLAAAVALDEALAWRTGRLAFTNRSLGSVLHALARRFGLRITLADPALADRPLTYLNPNPSSGEAVLSDICHTLGLRYQRTANGFIVRR